MPESAQIPTTGKTEATQDLYNNLVKDAHRILQMVGSNLTISSGAITVDPDSGVAHHQVDTESAASQDDLDTISGGEAGDVVTLFAANASRRVTLKHNTGNIQFPGGVDVNLSTVFGLMLRYDGSDWLPIGGMNSMVNAQFQIFSFKSRATNGAGFDTLETSTNKINLDTVPFPDGATTYYAQKAFALPADYDGGPVRAKVIWLCEDSATDTAVFQIRALALGDGDDIDTAMGTQQVIADDNNNNTYLNISGYTPEITIAGDPAAGNLVIWEVYRDPTHGSDDLGATAQMVGLIIDYRRL